MKTSPDTPTPARADAQKQTPTPWTYSSVDGYLKTGFIHTPLEKFKNVASDLTYDDAKFICECVNSHDALVAALELVVEQDDRSGLSKLIQGTDGDARTDYDEYYLGAIQSARAALAAASEGAK